ncbi:MAG: hypothetical protein QXE96_05540 [Candidatus Caldarchaeum sp.]
MEATELDEKSYIAVADTVRLKLVHVTKAEPEASMEKDELERFPQLLDALQKAKNTASTTIYLGEFEALNPAPVVVTLSKQDAEKFVELVKRKTSVSLYKRAVKIGVDGDVFIVAVEHHCG